MSKAVAPFCDTDTNNPLRPDTKSIAEAELGETDHVRSESLKAMRDWLDQNPLIVKCRYDAKYLLKYLRHRKFSVLMAQRRLEEILIKRSLSNGKLSRLDLEEANVADLLNRGFIYCLPNKDSMGRTVALIRIQAIDLKKHKLDDLIRLVSIVAEVTSNDEENQVLGFVIIADYAGLSWQHFLWTSPSNLMKASGLW